MAELLRIAGRTAALLFGLRRPKDRRRRAEPQPEPGNPRTRSEATDVPLWLAGLLAGLAVAVIGLVVVSVALIFPHSIPDRPKALTTDMPEPRLQADPAADLRAYREDAERRLDSYGWADRDAGLARVPIGEAMRRVAERGIPDWPKEER